LLLTFAAFAAAANCEATGELVAVSASAGALKKIAAIKMAKNFIIGSPASPQAREVRRGLEFSGAYVKRSPPKRLRNASAAAVSGKQNRI
jgi:hypothetical protein